MVDGTWYEGGFVDDKKEGFGKNNYYHHHHPVNFLAKRYFN